MTRFTVTVCLAGAAVGGDPLAALTVAMRPYDDEAGPESFNEDGAWDSWAPGSDDNFVVLPAYGGDPRLFHAPHRPDNPSRPRDPCRCDGAPRGLLDLERMRETYLAEARVQWASGLGVEPGATEDEHLRRAAVVAVPTQALLLLDGRWADPSRLGPLGAPDPGESADDAYWRLADAYLRALPDDAFVAQLRCHR
ncbi:hypothetical protein ABZ901_30860 [Actinacidiphila alni]|uniref:hypothetical protein n=1 Tax=Actinacidiphila alni TaxID=380248 RepID=UPI0033FDBDBD